MRIIELLIRRRVLTTVLALIAIILGALAYVAMGVRRFPKIDFPVVTVITRYPGASPAEVETEITKRIEDTVSTISGIESVTSTSQQGLSLVFIEFALEEDVDVKAIDVRNKIDLIRYLLPPDADDPIPQKFEIGSFPIMELALSGERDVNELYRLADEDLRPLITQVQGVADVNITGGQEREVHVLLDGRKLRKYRVSIGAVAAALRASNIDVPAGTITQRLREYVVRTPARFRRVEEIQAVRVPNAGGGILTVADLGEVVDTYEDQRTASRFDGDEAVIISILSRSDANEVEVADGISDLLPRLRERLPRGAKLEVARDTSVYIRGALANVRQNMLLGFLLTAAALYLFLKSFRATVIVGIAMPASVVVAFIGMRAAGFTLNIISLTGLAMVIGVLVNNAILILENATRLVDEGMEPVEAAIEGTRDIALAIMGSTATNLVVFIPIAFMGEIIGRFFKELGLTVVFATVVSLLISFSLTPMMCGAWLKARGSGADHGPSPLTRLLDATVGRLADLARWLMDRARGGYAHVLDWCLLHRISTVLLTLLAVVGSAGVFVLVGFEFMPPEDEGRFVVTAQMPVGTPLAVTDQTVRRIEELVQKVPHLEHYTVKVGARSGFGVRTEGVDLAEVLVTVADRADRTESLDDLINMLSPSLASLPAAKVSVSKEAGGPQEAPIVVEISGDDLDAIQRVAARVEEILQATAGTASVASTYEAGQPELRVIPVQDEVNRQGLTRAGLANEVRAYIEGQQASQFLDRDENYDIVVKLEEGQRSAPDDVGRMFISSPTTGQMLPIGRVARIDERPGSALISRKDRMRLISVSSQLTGERPLSQVLSDVRRQIDQTIDLPEGVTLHYGGEVEAIWDNFKELFKAMGIASALTFLSTAGLIESFGFALVIIFSLPICVIGIALAMLIYGVTVNIFSLMGMVVFVGIAVNNAIIVVDYAMRAEQTGKSAVESIREACLTRFRMVLLTNLTNIVALTPLSLGLGFAGEVFKPLAVVQIGGNLSAMILTLLVIPAIYVMVRRRRHTPVAE